MPERLISIVIADDHPIFRHGLRKLLDSETGMQVVADAHDGLEAVRLTRQHRPDILLLDLAMPRLGGLKALADLLGEGAEDSPLETRVIVLTAAISSAELLRALQLGVRGVVLKDSATRVLAESIRAVAAGGYWLGPGGVENLVDAIRRLSQPTAAGERPYGLTRRELEIVAAVAAGESNKQIAERYAISLQTVKHHLTSIFDKTGVSTRLELGMFAIKHHLAGE